MLYSFPYTGDKMYHPQKWRYHSQITHNAEMIYPQQAPHTTYKIRSTDGRCMDDIFISSTAYGTCEWYLYFYCCVCYLLDSVISSAVCGSRLCIILLIVCGACGWYIDFICCACYLYFHGCVSLLDLQLCAELLDDSYFIYCAYCFILSVVST